MCNGVLVISESINSKIPNRQKKGMEKEEENRYEVKRIVDGKMKVKTIVIFIVKESFLTHTNPVK